MKIRTRVLISTALPIGLVLMLGLLFLFSQTELHDRLKEMAFVHHVVEEVFELTIITNEYVSSKSKSSEFRWESKHKALSAIIGSTAFDDRSRTRIWERVAKNHRVAKDIFLQLKGAKEREKSEGKLLDQLTFKSQTIVSNAFALGEITKRDLEKIQKQVELLWGVFIVLLILVSIFNSVKMLSALVMPIDKLREGVEIINKGALDYRVAITSRDEIGTLASAFNQMTDKRQLIENDLRKSSAQLLSANKELEAFSYSVSHDLRAPLRAIDSFSRILLEDHADRLDKEGKRVLSIISNNVQKMGRLIDDLLAFSRLDRKGLHTSQVNMNQLTDELVSEFKADFG